MKKKVYYNIWKSPFKIRFQKKNNISSSGARTHELRAKIEKFFVRFLVQMKSAKSSFKINWPLVWNKNVYSAYPPCWFKPRYRSREMRVLWKVFIKSRWPDEIFTPELSNLSTQIMFYKQLNYWTTSQHFSNV